MLSLLTRTRKLKSTGFGDLQPYDSIQHDNRSAGSRDEANGSTQTVR